MENLTEVDTHDLEGELFNRPIVSLGLIEDELKKRSIIMEASEILAPAFGTDQFLLEIFFNTIRRHLHREDGFDLAEAIQSAFWPNAGCRG